MEEKKVRTWEFEGITFKECPGCKKGIHFDFDSHKCGWNMNGKPSENAIKTLKVNTEVLMSMAFTYVESLAGVYTPEAKARMINMFIMDFRTLERNGVR